MMQAKKIISASSAIMIAGISILSPVSVMATESADENTSVSDESVNTDDTDTMKDPYAQCMAYVKSKNLTGVDCRAKAESMHQEIRDGRMQMNQEIRDGRVQVKQENAQNRQMMKNNMTKNPMPTGELKNFLKNPLTPEEQNALKALMKKQQSEHEALIKDTTLSPEEKAEKMKDLMTSHITAMLAYIDTDKQDAFKKMMEEKISMMVKNQELRRENENNRQEFNQRAKEKREEFRTQAQAKKQALSKKLHGQLVKAIEKLSTEKLSKILANVDKVAAKIESSNLVQAKKDRFLAQLEEIKTIIQNKIDELAEGISDESIIKEVLSDSTTSSATGTTVDSGSGTTSTAP